MSYTYSLGCAQCKRAVWIAQSNHTTGLTLYTGEPETMEALRAFLHDHIGHPLCFDDNVNTEVGDWLENPLDQEEPS